MVITFSTADCDVFARNPKKVKWPDGVSEADRKIFIDIRDRVQQLAKELASRAKLSVGLQRSERDFALREMSIFERRDPRFEALVQRVAPVGSSE